MGYEARRKQAMIDVVSRNSHIHIEYTDGKEENIEAEFWDHRGSLIFVKPKLIKGAGVTVISLLSVRKFEIRSLEEADA